MLKDLSNSPLAVAQDVKAKLGNVLGVSSHEISFILKESSAGAPISIGDYWAAAFEALGV